MGIAARIAWTATLLQLAGVASASAQNVAVLSYQAAEAPVRADALRDAMVAAGNAAGASIDVAPFAGAQSSIDRGALLASRLSDFRRAEELRREGWRAYLGVNQRFAAARLGAARRVAERVVHLQGGLELYAEISLRLAVVLLDLKRADESADQFRLAATLDPSRLVTLAEFSPDVVKAYADAIAAAPKPVRVEVDSWPADGVIVEIDGHVVGEMKAGAPVVVSLPPGQHIVVTRKPGFEARGQVFAVRRGPVPGVRGVRVVLDRDRLVGAVLRGPAALTVGRSEKDARIAVEGLAIYGHYDAIMLVAAVWRRNKPALLGQVCSGIPTRCSPVAEIGFPSVDRLAHAARMLWKDLMRSKPARRFPPMLLIDSRLVKAEGTPGKNGTTNGTNRRRWWENPYLWLGVGAAAVTVGAVVILNRDSEVQPIIVGDPCNFIPCGN